MKITEKMLLDGYQSISNGYNYISDINGERYWWNYRHDTMDGYQPVTDRANAEWINLDNPWPYGHISLDSNCDDHPAVARIEADEANHYSIV